MKNLAKRLPVDLVSHFTVALSFGVLAWIGIELTRGEARFAALWLPNALLVASLLHSQHRQLRLYAFCYAANVTANVIVGDPFGLALLLSVANVVEAWLVIALLRRSGLDHFDIGKLDHIMRFSAIGGIAAPAFSAVIATTSLMLMGKSADLWIWFSWAFTDGLGMVLGVPTFLIIAAAWNGWSTPAAGRVGEWVLVLAASAAGVLAVFLQSRFPFLFLICPLVLLAAFRLGPAGTVTSISIITVIASVATVSGTGPIMLVQAGAIGKLWIFQLFLVTNYAIGLSASAALAAKKQTTQELRDQREFTALILASISEVIFRTDADGRWTFLNSFWSVLSGFPANAEIGRSSLRHFHPDDHETLSQLHEQLRAGKLDKGVVKHRLIAADGSIRYVETGISALRGGPHDAFIGAAGNIRDVTEQHIAAETLSESQRMFRTLANLSPAGIFRTDNEGNVTYVNDAWLKLSGLDRETAMGPGWAEALHPDDRVRVLEGWGDAVAHGEGYRSEFRFVQPDSSTMWIAVISAPDVNDEGAVVGHIGVNIDITERKDMEGALHEARERAENAASVKASFLANMSHEIRTPMNGVIGFTNLLLRSQLDHKQRRHAELIAESGKAMMRLLNDILDISKIDAGQMKITRDPIDLRAVIRGSIALVQALAEDKGIGLDCAVASDVPAWVVGDGMRIRQIVLNLLGNALKFTHHGSVIVHVTRDPENADGIVIEVVDTGIGIPLDRQAAIFEEFVQATDSTAREHGGTGLGLAISLKLIRQMDGDLTVESAVGKGSRFRIFFPAPETSGAGITARATTDGVTDRRRSTRKLRRARILLAEDHDINQELVATMLEDLGQSVEIAEDGETAMRRVRESAEAGLPFDLILMDMRMPGMGGVAATRAIRAAGYGADRLPIVALTANAYSEDVTACLEAGMQAHLAKPLGIDDLQATLSRWVPSAAPAQSSPLGEARISPKLRAKYEARKRDVLECVAELIRTGATAGSSVKDAEELLHKLAGTAGMFGEPDLGVQARDLKTGLECWDDDVRLERLHQAFTALKAAA